jgi:hypothetical protein
MANNRLPFGLCKKYGIKLPTNATPKDAWEALKKNGIEYIENEKTNNISVDKAKKSLKIELPESSKYIEKEIPEDTQISHLEQWSPPPPLEYQLANRNRISVKNAEEQISALSRYSQNNFSEIRKAQYSNDITSPHFQDAILIEDFISKSPKWRGGELYRGVGIPINVFETYQVGGTVDMKGVSSWSSDEKVGKEFADQNVKAGEVKVIFKSPPAKNGTSITHLSYYGKEESEVLVSNQTKWRISNISDKDDYIIVELEEK